MEIQQVVAQNTKRLREQRRLTLDGAAQETGVSRSMLAQIERGDVNPTISVLWKIANGYKISFTSLIEDTRPQAGLLLANARPPMVEDDGRYINYRAFPFDDQRHFETYRIEIAPGGGLEAQPHLADTEEYITVFSGVVEITSGGECVLLSKGDSLRFQADRPHAYRNPGTELAQLSMLIYYEN